MSTSHFSLSIIQVCALALLALGLFAVPSVHANTPFTAALDVAGGTVVSGQPITLNWFVTGGPATCEINNNVGTFEVTSSSEGGSISGITLPDNGGDFEITCTKGSADGSGTDTATDGVTVIPNPVVTFVPRFGTTTLVRGISGVASVDMYWRSEYATECSGVSYVDDLNTTPVFLHINRYGISNDTRDRYKPDGRFVQSVSASKTYSITCTNSVTGAQTTAEITMTVLDPPPLPPVQIDVIRPEANPAQVQPHPVREYASVRYEFRSRNTSWCRNYQAYNLHEYPTVTTDNPVGYSANSRYTNRNIELRLATSTILSVECGRDELTFNGVTYPATSTTEVRTFIVNQGTSTAAVATTSNQYATATVVASPNPVTRTVYGYEYIDARVTAANADFCRFIAYDADTNSSYWLEGWSTKSWQTIWTDGNQNLDIVYTPALERDTVLEVVCTNIYDFYFGDVDEQANAVFTASTTVIVDDPVGGVQDPRVWLYSGPSLHLTATDIWDMRTAETNLEKQYLSGSLKRDFLRPDVYTFSSGNLIHGSTSVSFPFEHQHGVGETDVYNIHMRICDESDGAAVFSIYTDRSGLVGTHVADEAPASGSTFCGTSTEEVELVAEGVVIGGGDTITIQCEPHQLVPGSGNVDTCLFSDVYFGTGSDNITQTIPEDPDNPINQLIWMSEGATECSDMVATTAATVTDPVTGATTTSTTTYTWAFTSSYYGALENAPVNNVTNYSINCERPSDNVSDSAEVTVVSGVDPADVIEPQQTATSSTPLNFTDCWAVDPSNTDTPVGYRSETPVPTGYVQAPAGFNSISDIFTGIEFECIPYVDLSVAPVYPGTNISTDSVVNIGDGVDNVNGTFDLSIIPFVQNLSAVDLPANAQITYNVNLQGGVLNQSENGFYNALLPANTPLNTYQLTNMSVPSAQFGTYTMSVRFNLDGSPNYPDSNLVNNTFSAPVTLPVPTPHMRLELDDGRSVIDNSTTATSTVLVRAGESVNLVWSVNVNYLLDCTLTGPTIGTQNLVLGNVGSNIAGTNPSTASVPVTLQSTSEFELACIEPTTSTPFRYTGLIEVTPDFQEF